MLKNKKILAAIGVIILLLIGGAVYVLSTRQNSSPKLQGEAIEVIPTIMPDEIGLEFVAKSDKKYVKFTINKPEGIEKVEYEITYDAVSEGNMVAQALAGDLTKDDAKDGKLGIDYRELGTCSTGGKCRFDQGVESVKLILKITKSDGKVFQTEKSINL